MPKPLEFSFVPAFLVCLVLILSGVPVISEAQDNLSLCQEAGYSSGAPGKVRFRILNADLRIREDETDDFKVARELISFVRESTGSALSKQENLFKACTALSAAGVSFHSERLTYYPHIDQEPEWKNPDVFAPTLKSFKDQCLDKMPPPDDKGRLENIIKNFPETYPFYLWKAGLDQRTEKCQGHVVQLCKNVDVGKSPLTMGVVTKCTIKNLTAEDVRKNVSLKETLKLCGEAQEYGYHWTYQDPPLPEACLKKKKRR